MIKDLEDLNFDWSLLSTPYLISILHIAYNATNHLPAIEYVKATLACEDMCLMGHDPYPHTSN